MSTMINNITQFEPRTEIIINEIKTNIEEGRKILLLSDRRDHLREIKDKLDATEITRDSIWEEWNQETSRKPRSARSS